ncbi:MAG: heat-shock protein [Flavobacteriaceae bacterium CG_4_8_14_3_um_filter_34_10]|nr:TetR/AcrR family transcriptional regulator [Flavobacteriia bacterium]OIP52210.1 MAG: heat-shock protein [Flavobacteriaceae bacterium CG2_30_34_30]PIQ17958.1 MAG: heat-shock protein [Flavobacteriaceae bacterium CG18_big_fil_WC_8_21_14_2_50_34_36]PIV51680.1 MAG: heat-shock protein [Flavobacteriaceae bacterium CG02_land_8_20_14_3_00_34_13]PIX09381.1 MAG: heat-shock protein [Flavobacteriaceae bacterium CG_4_8_14_3_um_filter_34_10]PIZ07484.1 MAG: heat-shock protein [Flavobacteriaceae bacterium C
MAATKKTKTKMKAEVINDKITQQYVIDMYINYVLDQEQAPKSVYKFARDNGFSEAEFYQFFGSFDGLKAAIWTTFFEMTMDLAHKNKNYESNTNQEKMLTFFFTFFELLTANRSYVLFTLKEHTEILKNMQQLSGLRKKIKVFATDLIENKNDEKQLKILKQPAIIFSEGAWLQTIFILKFWMDDNSPAFEKTDLVIEKSVRAIFEVFATSPIESVIDFGKFLWKEKMA